MNWIRIFLVAIFFVVTPVYAYEYPQETIVIDGREDTAYIVGHVGPVTANYILSLDPKKIKRIELNSYGGKLLQAMKIARFIRNNNIDTYVGRYSICYSACTILFQAGIKRTAHITAKFLYHYAYDRIGRDRERKVPNIRVSNTYFNYLVKCGATPELIGQIKIGRDLILSAKATMKYSVVTILEKD